MIEQSLNGLNLGHWAITGLVIFFTLFVGIIAWALTRSRKEVHRWSALPLEEDPPRRG